MTAGAEWLDSQLEERRRRVTAALRATSPRAAGWVEDLSSQYWYAFDHAEHWHDARDEAAAAARRLQAALDDDVTRATLIGDLLPGLKAPLDRLEPQFTTRITLDAPHHDASLPWRDPNGPSTWMSSVRALVTDLWQYDPSPIWLSQWFPTVAPFGSPIQAPVVALLATELDAGDDALLGVLDDVLAGADPTATLHGLHLQALASSSRPECWARITELLATAGREEGLRERILTAVSMGHPGCIAALLAAIDDGGLVRFSGVIAGLSGWLAHPLDAGAREANQRLVHLMRQATDRAETRATLLASDDPVAVAVALWAAATIDIRVAAAEAASLLEDHAAPRREPAVWFATTLKSLRPEVATPLIRRALGDTELSIAGAACRALRSDAYGGYWNHGAAAPIDQADVAEPSEFSCYDELTALLQRMPPRSVPGTLALGLLSAPELSRSLVANALVHHHWPVIPDRVAPYLAEMDPSTRSNAVAALTNQQRDVVLAHLSDRSSWVRDAALERIGQLGELDDGEALELEPLLKRKGSELRRGVLGLIEARGAAWTLGAAERLLSTTHAQQRQAGVDLLSRLVADPEGEQHDGDDTAGRSRAFAALRALTSDRDEAIAHAAVAALDMAAQPMAALTPNDAFGLVDPSKLTPPQPPRTRDELNAAGHRDFSEEAAQLVLELHAWIRANSELAVPVTDPALEPITVGELDQASGDWIQTPVAAWCEPLASAGELALTQVRFAIEVLRHSWLQLGPDPRATLGFPQLHGERDNTLLTMHTLVALAEPATPAPAIAADWSLRRAESLLDSEAAAQPYAAHGVAMVAMHLLLGPAATGPARQQPTWFSRAWPLARWIATDFADRFTRGDGAAEQRLRADAQPPIELLAVAHSHGAATDDDVLQHLIGPQGKVQGYSALAALTGPRPGAALPNSLRAWDRRPPAAVITASQLALADRARQRVIDVELLRGEAPTEATPAIEAIAVSGGLQVLRDALAALRRDGLKRGWAWRNGSRGASLSALIAASAPGAGDTPAAFVAAMQADGVPKQRIIELACFAPQWAEHAAAAVGQPLLESAVWWLHAQTAADDDGTPSRTLEEIGRRSELSPVQLSEGEVDVEWFRSFDALSDKHLAALLAAAKFITDGTRHTRAVLFADALRRRVTPGQLITKIEDKRHQDSVRALGLIPLDDAEPAADLLRRYNAIQTFIEGRRAFGSQRRASDLRAGEIGLDNLARTAGYRDPVRLGWRLERESIAELRGDGTTVARGELRVTLRVDDDGAPHLEIARGARKLKAVPVAEKKHPEIAELLERHRGLAKIASRARTALETAMVRGDHFAADELRTLREHALLWPALRSLLIVTANGRTGLLSEQADAWSDADGNVHELADGDTVRLAHPVDVAAEGSWPRWQRLVLERHITQPFKQVFRELYLPVPTEEQERGASRRYAGHQIKAQQSKALLTNREWQIDYYQGPQRLLRRERLVVALEFREDWGTAADYEPATIERLTFIRSAGHAFEGQPVALGDVPPRIFSEVMRDIDLVVSVAHASGADPEASLSTVQARAALAAETAALLGYDNVTVEDRQLRIEGVRGTYAVHLGSGQVRRLPGGAVCIIAVGAQQRGRVFLPFADDDPRTAEILAKMLLLARDGEIRDPTILEQLR